MQLGLIVLLVALTGSNVACLYYEQKQLLEAASFQGKAKADEILTKLNSDEGPLTNEQVLYLLGGLSRTDKIGSFLVPQFTNLARVSTEKCLKGSLIKHETICSESSVVSLKRYCQFCLEQLLEFCREHKDSAVTLYWLTMGAQIDRATREIQLVSSRFNKYVTDKKLEISNSVEGNLTQFCATGSQLSELMPLNRIKQNCRLLVQVVNGHLTHLGLSAEATIEIIEVKFKLAFRESVGFCKLLLRNFA